MKYNKKYLYNMFNATSTEHPKGSGEIETYEHWLERQLIARLERIDVLEASERSSVAENEQVKEDCDFCDGTGYYVIGGELSECPICD